MQPDHQASTPSASSSSCVVDASPTPPGDVVLLRDSSAYQQDRLGLRTLDEKGALHVLDAKCLHYDFEAMPASVKLFVTDALLPFLTKLS